MTSYIQQLKMISLLLIVACFTIQARESINNYNQLKNYIEQCVANLFYPYHDTTEIKRLQRDIVQKIDRNYNIGFLFFDYYDQEKVYQITIDEAVNFIADKAYAIKGERARIFIRKELIDNMSRMSEIPIGYFNNYMGQSLRDKLSHIGGGSTQPLTVSSEKLYPSTECCICYQEFDGTVQQIFLSPCGHDLCKECCKSYFFNAKGTQCPQCRATVNITALRDALFPPVPSAPAWHLLW